MKPVIFLFLSLFLSTQVLSENVKANCPSGTHWVSPHFRRAYSRADGTFVRETNVQGHCRTNQIGYEIWNDRIKNVRPKIWGYKEELSKKFTPEEVERILDALASLPELLREQVIKAIHRMSGSRTPGNPATSNEGDIVLYDEAFSKNQNLARVLGHELAHRLYEGLSKEERVQYEKIANWKRKRFNGGFIYLPRKADTFVKPDGLEGPEEDFANNIEHYVFESDSLKKKTPIVYDWIRQKFGDKLRRP